jgi:hypothetical protein
MNTDHHVVRRVGIALSIAALLAVSSGCSAARSASDAVTGAGRASSLGSNAAVSPLPPTEAGQPAVAQNDAAKSAETVLPDRLIISNASMAIQVDDVDKTLAAVRALAVASGSQISQLNVQAGDGGVGGPVPLGDGSVSSSSQSSNAQVTLRVPAEKLASVESQAAKLGKVLSQSAAESDVTQQHVDLAARLKNLQAEEVRLRGFLDKATKVSEMLEIERELSRVRGEIEAMQAQIAYLDQQAAMATLTLAFSAPGAIVQPSGGTWGFSAAVTTGVQAAAALLRTLIVLAIALSPLLLVVFVIVLIWRSRRRRRLAARAAEAGPETAAQDTFETPEAPPTE